MSRCGILSNSFLHLLRWPYSFCLFFFFDVVHYMIGLCCWTILVNLGWIPLGCGVWSFFVCCWIWFSDILLRIFASINEVKVLVAQLCLTLCDCSPPGPSVHGILWARILEWVAMASSRESSQPRNWTQVSPLQVDSLPSEPPGKPWPIVSYA